jgi:hypothetical protein
VTTGELNRRWYEADTGQVVTDVQSEQVFDRRCDQRKRRPTVAE